jgi:ribosomal-protein-alanine N-acetyltransferase
MKTRLVAVDDAEILSNYYQQNLNFFKPWEPTKPKGFHDLEEWQKRIKEIIYDQDKRLRVNFISTTDAGDQVIAHCNLSQIFFGAFCACYMGYAVSKNYEGKGIMYKTCSYAISYAFDELKLHRIMANYMPNNHKSEALLKNLGFVKEGYAKDYLEINGQWQDHVLTSLTNQILKYRFS